LETGRAITPLFVLVVSNAYVGSIFRENLRFRSALENRKQMFRWIWSFGTSFIDPAPA